METSGWRKPVDRGEPALATERTRRPSSGKTAATLPGAPRLRKNMCRAVNARPRRLRALGGDRPSRRQGQRGGVAVGVGVGNRHDRPEVGGRDTVGGRRSCVTGPARRGRRVLAPRRPSSACHGCTGCRAAATTGAGWRPRPQQPRTAARRRMAADRRRRPRFGCGAHRPRAVVAYSRDAGAARRRPGRRRASRAADRRAVPRSICRRCPNAASTENSMVSTATTDAVVRRPDIHTSGWRKPALGCQC